MERSVENARKKNHWVNCCKTKLVHEASAASSDDFVLEEVTTSKEKKVIKGIEGTNIPVVGQITVKCKFCDTEEQSEF